MKTPIAYYGGKTNMLKHILPLIPEGYRTYAEPFIGGGAVLFGKNKDKVEIINDKLDICVNFYRVCKTDYAALKKMLDATLHSESDYQKAKEIIKAPVDAHDEVTRAWAFWVQNNMTFSHKIGGGFAFARDAIAKTTANRIDAFSNELCDRLRNVQIFNRDALDIIKRFDAEDTFFYLDPPYANSNCGHYEKGKEVFYDLLELLPSLQGCWLLSSYPCDELTALWQRPGIWHIIIDKPLSVSGKRNQGKRKKECLTYNYNVE